MSTRIILAVSILAGSLTACGTNDAYEQQLRDALAEADVSLVEAIEVAEAHAALRSGRRAQLEVEGEPQFVVDTDNGKVTQHFVIALSGDVMTDDIVKLDPPHCGTKTLAELVLIAEAEVTGQGTSIALDDDEGCQYEVQVLTADDLMEVEVTGDGVVTEVEVSDDGASDDD